MKQILKYALIAIALTTVAVGCQREALELYNVKPNGKIEVLPDGRLKIPLNLTLPSPAVIQTRSSNTPEEERMTSLYVLVWEGAAEGVPIADDSKLVEWSQGIVYTNPATNESTAFVILSRYDNPCFMRVYVNLDKSTRDALEAYTPGVTTFADHKLLTIDLGGIYTDYGTGEAGGAYANLSAPFPMSSDPQWQPYINATADDDFTFELNSSTARMDVSTTVDDFTILDVTLLNGAVNGFIRQQTYPPANLGGTIPYAPVPAVMNGEISTNSVSPIYLFANNGDNPASADGKAGTNATYIVVRGQKAGFPEGYYKVQIRYLKTGDVAPNYSYSIVRNTLYAVSIIEANGPGFASLAEAIANTPQNLVTDISVTDGTSTDIFASNGRYYLGLSNSEFIVYSAGAQPSLGQTLPMVATTLTWGGQNYSGAVTNYQGVVPTFSITTTGGIGVSLNSLPAYNTPTPITISFPAAPAGNDYVGDITIRIGDLMKSVKVYQKGNIRQTGAPLYDFEKDATIVMGDMSGAEWIGLSKTNISPVTWGGVVDNSSGVVIHFKTNETARRENYFYLSTNNDRGRIKIYADQNVPAASFSYCRHASDALFWVVDKNLFDLASPHLTVPTSAPPISSGLNIYPTGSYASWSLDDWRSVKTIWASSNANIDTEYAEGRYATHRAHAKSNVTSANFCIGLNPTTPIATNIGSYRYYLPAQAELQMIHAYHTDRKEGWYDDNFWSSTQGTTNANANAINFLQEGSATNTLDNNANNAYTRCMASPHGLRNHFLPEGMATWDGKYYPYLATASTYTKSDYPLIVNYEIFNGYERGMRSFSLTQERPYELRQDSHEDEENYPQFRIAVADASGGAMMSWHTAMGYTAAAPIMVDGKAFFTINTGKTGCDAYFEGSTTDPVSGQGKWRLPTTAELQSIWANGGSNFQTAGGAAPRLIYPTKNKQPNASTTTNQTTYINPASENIHFINTGGDLLNQYRLPSLYNLYPAFTPMNGGYYWAGSTYKEEASPGSNYTRVYQHNFANGLGALTAISGGTGYVRCVMDKNP